MKTSKRYGIIGAVCAPVVQGIVFSISCMFPFSHFMYSVLQKVYYIPTHPLLLIIKKIIVGCGISVPVQGARTEEALAFILPIFLAILVYWALIGFGLGFLIGRIKEAITRRQSH